MKKQYIYTWMQSPLGALRLVGSKDGLTAILWKDQSLDSMCLEMVSEDRMNPVLVETEKQLEEYFAGKRKSFNLVYDFTGTDFQEKVWKALLDIPYGETVSYGQIAKQIGNPKAVRAVGAANSRNPIPIIAACHRVISASGKLTGYTGGLETKAYLLKLEGNVLNGKPLSSTKVAMDTSLVSE